MRPRHTRPEHHPRYDDEGRLADEWIQTDKSRVLRQLGA
jgi:hypothetical protein